MQVGRIAPLGPEGVPSAFVKHAVVGPVRVGLLGLDGDAQADLQVHGGPDKAVYAYSAAHYLPWAREWPDLESRFRPGAFGENLTVDGLVEADLCVGDIHGIGTARLQVCQPRQPCFKLALNFGNTRLPKALVRSGRSGWYYRVLQPGTLQAGDAIELLQRPLPDFPFTELLTFLYSRDLDAVALERVAHTKEVAGGLRGVASQALDQLRGTT